MVWLRYDNDKNTFFSLSLSKSPRTLLVPAWAESRHMNHSFNTVFSLMSTFSMIADQTMLTTY